MPTGPVQLQGININAGILETLQGFSTNRNILKGITIGVGTGASIMQMKVVNRNHQPIEGATCRVLDAIGESNNVLSFDGVDDYVIGDAATSAGSYCVSFWLYLDSLKALNPGDWFISQRSGTSQPQQNWQIFRYTGANRIRANVWNTANTSYGMEFGPDVNPPTGEWFHIAFAVDTANARIRTYWDGSPYGNIAFAGTPSSGSTALKISGRGWDAGAGVSPFHGKMSDLRVWHYAPTDAEIAENYNKRLIGDEPNLAHYWKLDQSQGHAVDEVGNNDLTIYGATWQEVGEDFPIITSITGYDPTPYSTGTTNANGLTTLQYQLNKIHGLEVTLPGKRRFIMPFKRTVRGLLNWQVMLSDYLATFATDKGNILINSEPENNDSNFLISQ